MTPPTDNDFGTTICSESMSSNVGIEYIEQLPFRYISESRTCGFSQIANLNSRPDHVLVGP